MSAPGKKQHTLFSRRFRIACVGLGFLFICSCDKEKIENIKELATPLKSSVSVNADVFGFMPDGSEVVRYTLKTPSKLSVSILSYGGIIQSINMPDTKGNSTDIVWGFDDLADYIADQRYFGPLIGRYANRIEFGKYTHNNASIQLEANRKGHHLHGGTHGFHKALWNAESFHTAHSAGVTLHHFSPHGDNGYPGNMNVSARYELNDANELTLTFTAKVDKDSPVSLTNHSYFNLAGVGSVLQHTIQIHADHYTPVDDTTIPTGESQPVENTPFDFRQAKTIAPSINDQNQQLEFAKGYDHNWVIKSQQNDKILPMATLKDPASGRQLAILSDAPGLQFYSGNYLNAEIKGKKGKTYDYRTAVVLEPQQFPNAPNEPGFPNPIIEGGKTYQHTIIYRFTNSQQPITQAASEKQKEN